MASLTPNADRCYRRLSWVGGKRYSTTSQPQREHEKYTGEISFPFPPLLHPIQPLLFSVDLHDMHPDAARTQKLKHLGKVVV